MISPSLASARADLTNFLTRAQSRGLIDPARFSEIISQWHGSRTDLPLPFENTFAKLDDATIAAALLGMQNLNPRWRSQDRRVNEMEEILAALSLRRLYRLHEHVQGRYEKKSRLLALAFTTGSLALLSWHRLARQNVIDHLLRQTLLGQRGRISNPARTEHLMQRELGYLARFADDIVAHAVQGRHFSAPYLANRLEMYAGSARGEFYRGIEDQSEFIARLQPPGRPFGVVAQYIAQDDDNTCEPCHLAAGWYLIGDGPWPGTVCLGRAHCRCRRVLRYRPDIYAQLIGGDSP